MGGHHDTSKARTRDSAGFAASDGCAPAAGRVLGPAGYARRRRPSRTGAEKESGQAAKVWDNDNIPTTNGNISVVGQAGPSEAEPAASTPAGPTEKTGTPATPEQQAAIQADLNASKARLESLKTDLDIAQRKYALDQQTYQSNPNYTDKSGAQALDDEKEQIAAKQQEIEEAQKKVDELQAQADAPADGASK
jgi:hypothetical protein